MHPKVRQKLKKAYYQALHRESASLRLPVAAGAGRLAGQRIALLLALAVLVVLFGFLLSQP